MWLSNDSEPFVEKSIFPPLNCLNTLVKNQFTINRIYFWTLNSVPLYILMLAPHYLFLKIYFIDYDIIVVQIFPHLPPSILLTCHHTPLRSCPWVMHISFLASPCVILNVPLSILYLPVMLLNTCAFSLILLLPPPS